MEADTKNVVGTQRNYFRIAAWSAAGILLLVPLIAMQFSDEVNWKVGDFVIAGVMLAAAGITFELVVRKSSNIAYRAAVGIALLAGLLLLWVNGAVGIIGSENNDANLMYLGVLAIAIVGVIIARLNPAGMSRAMFTTAAATVLVAVIALIGNLGTDGNSWPRDVLGATVFFAALWIGSALLFQKSAGEQTPADPGEEN